MMDCVAAATDLKKLLVAHSHAETQVSVLGKSTYFSFFLFIIIIMSILVYPFLVWL